MMFQGRLTQSPQGFDADRKSFSDPEGSLGWAVLSFPKDVGFAMRFSTYELTIVPASLGASVS